MVPLHKYITNPKTKNERFRILKIEQLENEYLERINNEYEKIGNKLVGKFYKNEYIDQWKLKQTNYLYIYSNEGRSLSGIEFHESTITRVGKTVQTLYPSIHHS